MKSFCRSVPTKLLKPIDFMYYIRHCFERLVNQLTMLKRGLIGNRESHILNFEWSHECEQIMFQSSAVIDQLVDDICASIDFYFVYGPPGISAVLRLQLPLFVAAVCTGKYSERYMWIMEKLEMLSTLTGFEQTISLAHRLKEGQIYGIIPSK